MPAVKNQVIKIMQVLPQCSFLNKSWLLSVKFVFYYYKLFSEQGARETWYWGLPKKVEYTATWSTAAKTSPFPNNILKSYDKEGNAGNAD